MKMELSFHQLCITATTTFYKIWNTISSWVEPHPFARVVHFCAVKGEARLQNVKCPRSEYNVYTWTHQMETPAEWSHSLCGTPLVDPVNSSANRSLCISQSMVCNYPVPICILFSFLQKTSEKRKRNISDPALWQKPIYHLKIKENQETTQRRLQTLRLHSNCGQTWDG